MAAGDGRTTLTVVLVAALLDMMSLGLVMPVLPGLIEELTGSSAAAGLWTGIMASLWAAMQLVAAPVIGALSDRFGRRPVILVSTAGLSLDWVLMALAPNLWWLVVGRVVGGLTSASGTAIFACVADMTAPDRRARAFGLVGGAVSAGFVVGPALGGVLGELGSRALFWVAACLSGAAFLWGLFVLGETLPAEGRTPFAWRRAHPLAAVDFFARRRDLAGLAAAGFLLTFAHRVYTTVFVLFAGHAHGLGPAETGGLLALAGALDFVVQGMLVGPVTARLGERRTIGLGLGLGAAGLFAVATAPSSGWFVAAVVLNAGWGLAEPTIRAALSRPVADGEQGRLQAAVQSLASVAGVAGPVFFGWIYLAGSGWSPGLGFAVAALTLLAAWVCAGMRGSDGPTGSTVRD